MQDVLELHVQDMTRLCLNLFDTKFNELHTAQISDSFTVCDYDVVRDSNTQTERAFWCFSGVHSLV
jgi:hypothetical protein